MNFYLKACLSSIRRISVMIFGASNRNEPYEFKLYKDGNFVEKLSIFKCSSQNNIFVYELEMSKDFEFGHEYSISASDFPMAVIDVTSVTEWKEFDEMFYYDGDDLGSTYSREYTDFVLWAPLASLVLLKIENSKGDFEFHKLNREEKGIYRRRLLGDHLNQKYHYVITNSGVTLETNDPYGKGVSLNSEYSVAIDLSSLEDIKKITPKTLINSYNESIIYELNVRDFTEDSYTDIEAKGKYLGLAEENRKTRGGNPAGLDYLKYLEITTVQLQPVHDFRGVDDLNTSLSYNWGYDPLSYFALEGSYSINPSDALSRLKEFKIMISKLHENDIKVNMDVVFNHIYDYQNSYLERCVPNYYFRRRENGQIANASGCGNDLKTERKMLRKLIIDSLTYYIKTFDVDGFRFDLMGLLDLKTISEAEKLIHKLKKDAMVYGEGWDMFVKSKYTNEFANLKNASKLPNVAFFNDSYRNIVRGVGSQAKLEENGFLLGNLAFNDGFEFAYRASTVDKVFPHLFVSYNQSINYVECHDNATIKDVISYSTDFTNQDKIINLFNTVLLLSPGIPFTKSTGIVLSINLTT